MTMRQRLSSMFYALGFAFLIAALVALLAGTAHGQTVKPKPVAEKPKPDADTQSVHYPDLCSTVEAGSATWYLLLCMVR